MPKDFKPTIEALRQMIDKVKLGRLAAADEQAGAASFRDLVLGGGKGLSAALELLGDLPWYIPVNGTAEAWPQLTPARKRAFLAALRPLQADVALRMRLSIARGLFKIDPDSTSKLIVSTLQEMHKGGTLSGRDRSAVASVLIGKTKPWLLQLDMPKLKPADAKLIASCALEASAAVSPPAAFSVTEWAKPYAGLADLTQEARTEFGKALAKWTGRWQKQIAKLDLPDDVRKQLASARPAEREPAGPGPGPAPAPAPAESTMPSASAADSPAAADAQQLPAASKEAPPKAAEPPRRDHQQTPKHSQKPPGKDNLTISDLLRQIEHRFEQAQSELQATRHQLRSAGAANGGSGRRAGAEASEVAKLREENLRLTEHVEHLRATLDDLAEDRFDVAISRRADTDQPESDPLTQYKALLTLKLREEITKFQTLNWENHVDGLPLLLENVFNVLEAHGIVLADLPPPATPAKRRY